MNMEKTVNYIFLVLVWICIIGTIYIIYRTELLNNCVDAKEISGKMYSQVEECEYLFK